jgi:cation diffusion facilitator CzcD-associated flavoprotein CzcO
LLTFICVGVFGLSAAKTFHQLHPDKTLAILDSGSTLGGVWGRDRLYPGVKTNNLLGTYEYPDFPMDSDVFGVKSGEHMSGEVMHKYLTKYAEAFGILDKIRCHSMVLVAEHQGSAGGGWVLTVQNGEAQHRLFARKLVMAIGLTSEPFMLHIAGQESFDAPVFHSRDFAKYADTSDEVKRVTVFGGTKSAWDVVYAYASKGVKVDWVIRGRAHSPLPLIVA